MRNVFFLLVALALLSHASAQEFRAPKTMVGFLKPGTPVGVSARSDREGISIVIYTPDELAIQIDARELDLDALAAKYESVAKSRESALKKYLASREPDPSGSEEVRAQLYTDRVAFLGKIKYFGDDYILVQSEVDEKQKRVYATRFIKSIVWHSGLRYSMSRRRSSGRR